MNKTKWMNRMTLTAGVLAIGAWGLMAEPASATFIIDPDPGGDQFKIDVANKDVSSFSGKVGANIVNVTTIGNVDTGSGYANIGPVKDSTLTSLIFTPVNATLFGDFSFRGQLLEAGSVKLTVTDQSDVTQSFFFNGLPKNSNFARIGIVALAGSGETIKSVQIENDGFKSVRQIDFSSANSNPSVPEPVSILLLGSGLMGLAAWRRMKQGSNG